MHFVLRKTETILFPKWIYKKNFLKSGTENKFEHFKPNSEWVYSQGLTLAQLKLRLVGWLMPLKGFNGLQIPDPGAPSGFEWTSAGSV